MFIKTGEGTITHVVHTSEELTKEQKAKAEEIAKSLEKEKSSKLN